MLETPKESPESDDCLLIENPESWPLHAWIRVLKNESSFTGNAKRGAKLIMEFVKGMQWVKKEEAAQNKPDFPLSELRIVADNGKGRPLGRAFELDGHVYINMIFLSKESMFGDGEIVIGENKDQEIAEKGTADEMYFLSGIEEADHARFFHEHPEKHDDTKLHSSDVSSGEYHSQRHEYEAKLKQLKAAEQQNMDPVMIEILRKKIEIARTLNTAL